MTADLLKNIINNFSTEEFIHFFRLKNSHFKPYNEPVHYYNDDNFKDCLFIGEIPFDNAQRLHIYSFRVTDSLIERSGKKKQYEKGKRILKETNTDAGIFIFYSNSPLKRGVRGVSSFRFSLIYPEYAGTKREWSYFKRFTYFVSPQLTNKTFLQQIGDGDFSSLNKIKEAFSVDPVTKQFYSELQGWYFWAMDKIRFPEDYKHSDDPQKDKEIRNATNLIRLITRIIFIWFLREKGLVPPDLFLREKLTTIVLDFMKGKKASNFYNAILQNLFFGTLNQKMNERKFVDERGYPANKKEYGVKNLFRYGDKFLISKDEVLELFRDIPFLNGGLFDCLDKEDESGKVVYIDGFSRNPAKQASIPDYLFFQQQDERIDLSQYGLGTNRAVRGLIEILNTYNFTIDENTPIDQEIALDPELLGKVFENLLASYNPETATTARKATGSYYTPREIVDYMVEESLIAYLMTKLKGGDLEAKLRQLLSYTDEPHQFSPLEVEAIISAIDNIKILDPACGSGAFPMGILHKLVHILQKLDPENKHWHELQYQKALKESEEAFKQGDKNEREERLKEINEAFDEGINYPDYARKLYLIENCIYGVDIQPIAIQISKLRFFISLVLDQKIDRDKENLGIRALPNLETKFVAANTLIGLDRQQQLALRNPDIERKENELKAIRHKYFTAKTRTQKQRLQEKDRKIRQEIARLLINDGWGETTAKKIASFDIFDQNASADWFDPEWMFGVNSPLFEGRQASPDGVFKDYGGFDIVIGNPPYIRQEDLKPIKPILEKQGYQVYNSTSDIYTYFYEKGWQLLNPQGHLTFITSNKWMRAKYGEKLRKFFKEKTRLKKIIDFGGHKVFESATVDTNILIFQKTVGAGSYDCLDANSTMGNHRGLPLQVLNIKPDFTPQTDLSEYFRQNAITMNQQDLDDKCFTFGDDAVMRLKAKIERVGVPLKDWDVRIYRGIITGFNEAFIIDNETKERLCKEDPKSIEILKPILRGRDIQRYSYKWAGLWLIKIESGWTDKKILDSRLHGNDKTSRHSHESGNPEKIFADTYPAVYNHLKAMGQKEGKGKGLYNRDDQGDYWWELRDCDYYEEFEKEKLIYRDVGDKLSFAYEKGKFYGNNTVYFLNNGSKFLLALLNSSAMNFYYTQISSQLGDAASRAFTIFIEQLPIPKIPESAQQPFITLVDQILDAKKKDPSADTSALERQIDEMVYKLYGLTDEEIAIVEGRG